MAKIPFLSDAVNVWKLASEAFSNESKSFRKKQQWKSLFGVITNPRFTSKWFKILQSPEFLLIAAHRKRLYLKPYRVYMCIKWDKSQRVKVIRDTYRFIMSKGETFKQVITRDEGIEVARFALSDTVEASLILGYDERFRKEGELVLSFESDQMGGRIVASAFSFEEIETGRWVCRIGCIQGQQVKEDQNFSKTAQKLLNGLRPKSLIVFAIQELARQLGFSAVYGAGDSIHAYRKQHAIHLPWIHTIEFDYNAIWVESGGEPKSDGWYELPLLPVRKNAEEIKTHKRALYRRRYAQLDDISLKIADTIKNLS